MHADWPVCRVWPFSTRSRVCTAKISRVQVCTWNFVCTSSVHPVSHLSLCFSILHLIKVGICFCLLEKLSCKFCSAKGLCAFSCPGLHLWCTLSIGSPLHSSAFTVLRTSSVHVAWAVKHYVRQVFSSQDFTHSWKICFFVCPYWRKNKSRESF